MNADRRGGLGFIPDGTRGGKILLAESCLAEIRDLRLRNVRFSDGGESLIGENVPLSLYWQQYIDHAHPDRNTGSHGSLSHRVAGEMLIVEIHSANDSREVRSHTILTVSPYRDGNRFFYEIETELTLAEGARWRVTPNRSHGELEFCNLWPTGVFTADRTAPTRYQSCVVEQQGIAHRLPLLHIDTPARRRIGMRGGDRFSWIAEEENPCVEIVGTEGVEAGLCAYMWDAHFGLRPDALTAEGMLEGPRKYRARFRLHCCTREEVRLWTEVDERSEPEREQIPIVRLSLNSFRETFADPVSDRTYAWPWDTEILRGAEADVRFSREVEDDNSCRIAIEHRRDGHSRWIATTLGPAYGDGEFPDRARYRFSGLVKTVSLRGEVRLRLRLHRKGIGDIFDVGNYEIFSSTGLTVKNSDWTRLEVLTPPIVPCPDRLHLLCELAGEGACRFTAVAFEIVSADE